MEEKSCLNIFLTFVCRVLGVVSIMCLSVMATAAMMEKDLPENPVTTAVVFILLAAFCFSVE